MPFLLDSNVWIDYLRGVGPGIRTRVESTPSDEILVCSVVLAELLHGARKYGVPARRERLVRSTLSPYRSLPFDDEAAAVYGVLRHGLEIAGEKMASNDLMIAAIAIQSGSTLVTHDRAFGRIDGLRVEDWRQA